MFDDSTAVRTTIAPGSPPGYVFVAEGGETLCFVPEDLVTFSPDGMATVDTLGYFLAGWSGRNARWSDRSDGGAHVFPDARRLVRTGAAPELPAQLQRWHRLAKLVALS